MQPGVPATSWPTGAAQYYEVLSFLYILLSAQIMFFPKTITPVFAIFGQDHYLLQRCRKGARAKIIALGLVRAMLLDGYMGKSPSPASSTHRTNSPVRAGL